MTREEMLTKIKRAAYGDMTGASRGGFDRTVLILDVVLAAGERKWVCQMGFGEDECKKDLLGDDPEGICGERIVLPDWSKPS